MDYNFAYPIGCVYSADYSVFDRSGEQKTASSTVMIIRDWKVWEKEHKDN